tara:strand:- start:450 stop:869 length:420 start_codon:yes stop_codon:yes gene_type:complete
MSLYANINKRKKAGTSRSKSNSTITKKNYDNMKKGFKKAGGFPDMNNDEKITQADIFLKKKENGTIPQDAKKGGVKKKKKKADMMMYKEGGMKKKMGGKKKMYGGSAMKPMKKGMGGKMMKYKTGGFTLEPKTPNLDDL